MRDLIRRRRAELSMLGVAVIVVAVGGFDCGGGGSSGGTTGGGGDNKSEVITVCSGSPVPAGYVKVNDNWDPTSCGSPSTITYNVSTYQRYDNKPVGSYLNICAGAIPGGWVMTNSSWNPTSCGHPSSIVDNIYTIKRVS